MEVIGNEVRYNVIESDRNGEVGRDTYALWVQDG